MPMPLLHPVPVQSTSTGRTASMLWYGMLLFGLLCAAVPAFAQRANIWYFGERAGVSFSSGVPVPLFNSPLISFEASASICDESGNLLFYSNGGRVLSSPNYRYGRIFNRNHGVMPNGDLELSGGCNSAKQGALPVQDPGNPDHYYLFTLDCAEHDLVGGLRYCEIDMTLDGGLGDVTSMGNPLLGGVTESMVGIRHANGTDVWVLVHGVDNNEFHAFLITGSGITGPVTTAIGPDFDDQPGDMCVDLTSTKVHYAGSGNSSFFDFDPSTGVLSNFVDLGQHVISGAFSHSGRYLYTSEFLGTKRIFQYDLLAPDIVASEQIISSAATYGQPAMRLAPDGKIYIAHWSHDGLGVINHPDLAGVAADVQGSAVDLGGRDCEASLPDFVNDLLQPIVTGIATVSPAPEVRCTVADDELLIRCDANAGRYTIQGSNGALIAEGRLSNGSARVPIGTFAAGYYAVRVVADERIGAAPFAIVR